MFSHFPQEVFLVQEVSENLGTWSRITATSEYDAAAQFAVAKGSGQHCVYVGTTRTANLYAEGKPLLVTQFTVSIGQAHVQPQGYQERRKSAEIFIKNALLRGISEETAWSEFSRKYGTLEPEDIKAIQLNLGITIPVHRRFASEQGIQQSGESPSIRGGLSR